MSMRFFVLCAENVARRHVICIGRIFLTFQTMHEHSSIASNREAAIGIKSTAMLTPMFLCIASLLLATTATMVA